MRHIIYIAVILLVAGGAVARYVDHMTAQSKSAPAMQARAAAVEPPPSASSRSLTVPPDSRGHFRIDGRANGRPMDFMVDTGASVVVIRESDAARLGVRPLERDYTATVSTANGIIKAAPTRFDSIEVGVGIRVYDVAGLVLPDEALKENLLGLSFLSRLRRFEYANGRLVLEQ